MPGATRDNAPKELAPVRGLTGRRPKEVGGNRKRKHRTNSRTKKTRKTNPFLGVRLFRVPPLEPWRTCTSATTGVSTCYWAWLAFVLHARVGGSR